MPKKDLSYIDYLDPDHSETTTASTGPSYYAILKPKIYIYPKWAGTLNLQQYIKQPTAFAADGTAVGLVSESITGDILTTNAIRHYVCYYVFFNWLNQTEKAQEHFSQWRKAINDMQLHLHFRDFNKRSVAG